MRHLLLLASLSLGILLPYGQGLTFLIKYSIMIMLFLAFLDIHLHRQLFRWNHLWGLLATLGLGLGLYGLLVAADRELALIGFLTAVAPTGAVAPVLTSYLRAEVAHVTLAVLFNNCAIALLLPLLLPLLMGQEATISVGTVLWPVMTVLCLPLVLAQGVKRALPSLVPSLLRLKPISFYLFLANIYIATSRASYFIQHETEVALYRIALVGGVALLACASSFALGHRIGSKALRVESSMSVGRKNTMFAIWVALTFLDPFAALGPMFYIIFQNAYNSWQLARLPKIPSSAHTKA